MDGNTGKFAEAGTTASIERVGIAGKKSPSHTRTLQQSRLFERPWDQSWNTTKDESPIRKPRIGYESLQVSQSATQLSSSRSSAGPMELYLGLVWRSPCPSLLLSNLQGLSLPHTGTADARILGQSYQKVILGRIWVKGR